MSNMQKVQKEFDIVVTQGKRNEFGYSIHAFGFQFINQNVFGTSGQAMRSAKRLINSAMMHSVEYLQRHDALVEHPPSEKEIDDVLEKVDDEDGVDELIVLEQMVTNMQLLEDGEARSRVVEYLKSRFD